LKRIGSVFTIFCLVCLLLPAAAWSQGVQATLKGRVTDTSGAVVPNVKIEVKNTGTNLAVNTVTDSAGLYTVPFLTPGSYIVSAEGQHFPIE
jgi:protocatechuate 3,4-dioxygenase beta subunit